MLPSYSSDYYRHASVALRNSRKAAPALRQIPAALFIVKRKSRIERATEFFGNILRIRARMGFWLSLLTVFYFSFHCMAESLNAAALEASGGEPAVGVAGAGAGAAPKYDASKFMKPQSRFMGRPQQKSPEVKLREVSDMYEKHFLREMTKAMRSTVHESGFIQQNQAEKIFREQLDEHYVDKWSERGGIGFGDLIYKQLIDKFGVQLGIKSVVQKPVGPLPLDGGNRARAFQHPGKAKSTLSYKIDIAPEIQGNAPKPGARDVKAPWAGTFGAVKVLEDNSTQVELEHDNGLKSQVVFKGSLSKLSTGQKVQAGDTLGFLSSEAKSIYWTIETDKTPRPQTVSE